MKKVLEYVSVLIAVLIVSVSCRKEGEVIPRGKLAEIYAEMFVADQLILQDMDIRRTADTTLVYEPIFQKYGYTSDDYRASVEHYIKDPDRYARILRNTGVILEKRLKELKEEKSVIESLTRLKDEIDDFAPERIFALTGLGNPGLCTMDSLVFYVDSAGGEYFFDTREWLDTAYFGPEMSVKGDSVFVTDTAGTAYESVADKAATGSIGHQNDTPLFVKSLTVKTEDKIVEQEKAVRKRGSLKISRERK